MQLDSQPHLGTLPSGSELVRLPPWDLPQYSPRIIRARAYVYDQIRKIEDEELRSAVAAMLASVQGSDRAMEIVQYPSVMTRKDCTPGKLTQRLPYDPTWAAPGAGLASHHCYPGGWVLHTALNLRAARSLMRHAVEVKGGEIQPDAIISAIILHDCAKLKLLVWRKDHSLDEDQGAGHHIIALAECIARAFPVRVVQLLAGVHSGWWQAPEAVRKGLVRAAALLNLDLAETDYALDLGLHAALDGWIVHQAEVSWYTATRNAYQSLEGPLREWYETRNLAYSFNRVRHVIHVGYDELALLETLSRRGPVCLNRMLSEWWQTGKRDF